MSNHVERMREELSELYDKYLKLSIFLNQETQNPKFTDEIQRSNMKVQANIMLSYISILEARINYDTKGVTGNVKK